MELAERSVTMGPGAADAAPSPTTRTALVRQNTRMKKTGQCLQYLAHSKEVLKVAARLHPSWES